MPYVNQTVRKLHESALEKIEIRKIEDSGELNYLLTEICLIYLKDKELRYKFINDVIGALEGCKQEFYRRMAADYEDKAITKNGDVY
jgi:hypothetical protein